jgi:glycosyltransferase involved in cell wall biosynthesis
MDNFPKVSIIIPCWNAEKYIADAIESALGQSYPNIEVIVVNDGSTDKSLNIISRFDEILIVNQDNQGAPKARNNGIRCAKGSFIKFLDADDVLQTNCIAKQVEKLVDLSEKEIGYGYLEKINDDGYIIDALNSNTVRDTTLFSLIKSGILTSLPLYPIEALKTISGFDERLKSRQEWNLHIRLKLAGFMFKYFDILCYSQRFHSGVYRISNLNPRPEDEFKNLSAAVEPLSTIQDKEIRQLLAYKIWCVGRWYCLKNYFWAKRFFNLANSYDKIFFRSFFSINYRRRMEKYGPFVAEVMDRVDSTIAHITSFLKSISNSSEF